MGQVAVLTIGEMPQPARWPSSMATSRPRSATRAHPFLEWRAIS